MYGSRAQKWQWSRGWGTQLQGEQSGNKQMPLTKMPECNDYTGRPGLGGNCSRLSHPEKCKKGMGPTATPAGPLRPHGLTGLPILAVTENVSSAPKTGPQPEGWGLQNSVSGHKMQVQPLGRNVLRCMDLSGGAARRCQAP